MPAAGTLANVREIAAPILKRHGVVRAAVFGSCARGDMKPDSDIDILVEIQQDISLLDFIRIRQEISESLGREVDLVEYDSVKPRLRDEILNEQVPIL
jgi:predicted nucleotidyltransferase